MTQVNLQKRIRAILSYLDDDDLTLTKFTTINGSNKLFDQTKKGNVVLSVRDPETIVDTDVDAIHVDSINLLYDLAGLNDCPSVTMVEFAKYFQVMLPFATSEDGALVFSLVNTIIVNIHHERCITDMLPINKLFPCIDTLVLVFRNYSKALYCQDSYRCIKDIKCSTLVILNKFHKTVEPAFMQNVAIALKSNSHVTTLVIVNENYQSVVVHTNDAMFKYPIRIWFVRLKYPFAYGCNVDFIGELEL